MSTPSAVRLPTPRPTRRDRVRREAYLLELQLWLDAYPAGQRRRLVRQLRADLDAAAADSSMREAVLSLGDARALAREYLELLPRDRPRWQLGAAWACGWLVVWSLAVLVFLAALVQVAPVAGVGGVRASLLWLDLTVVRTDEDFSVLGRGVPWSLGVALALLLLVARAWRVVPALRPGRRGTD